MNDQFLNKLHGVLIKTYFIFSYTHTTAIVFN